MQPGRLSVLDIVEVRVPSEMSAGDNNALAVLVLQRDDDCDVALAEGSRNVLTIVTILQDKVIVLNSLFIDYVELASVGDDLRVNAAAVNHLVSVAECLEPVAVEVLEVVDFL